MAGREERLTPATRNYVLFGLLMVGALGLAIREWADPRERRGETDSALRLLIVSADEVDMASTMTDVDGLFATTVGPEQVIVGGRELLADDAAPRYRAAVAYADQQGYGFVALDLQDDRDDAVDWDLSESPQSSARFAVFSVGDVAVAGPRMHSFGLPDTAEFDPRLADLHSLRLGLYEHPDLLRLWRIEPNAMQLQARQVLDSREIHERREQLLRDQAAWRELDDAWPAPGVIAGSLASPWEQVHAAPIWGGLLLEVRPLRVHVDVYRRASIEPSDQATLHFVPDAVLYGGDPHETLGRQVCEGLPERSGAKLEVAPDGSAVVVQPSPGTAELFVFDPLDPLEDVGCRARSVGTMVINDRGIGRPSSAGAMAWSDADGWVRWADAIGEHWVELAGVDGLTEPWWVDGELLALLGDRSIAADAGEFDEHEEFERVLVLLGTAPEPTRPDADVDPDEQRVRVELGASELFPDLDPQSRSSMLVDLRPTGFDELLLTTARCEGEDERPCVHRLRSTVPLGTMIREFGDPSLTDALSIETLGPLGPYAELAVAPDGSRVAWIDTHEQNLMIADLHGANRLVPRRLDTDATPDTTPQISADGQIVLSEVQFEIMIGERSAGSVLVPRVFVLDPAALK